MRNRIISCVCCASLMAAVLIACAYGLFGPEELGGAEQIILSCIGAASLFALMVAAFDMFECWAAGRGR